MVKVMLYTTVSYDDDQLPFFKTDEQVWTKCDSFETAARFILDFDPLTDHNPLNNGRDRMVQVGSTYYYDVDHPEETQREWIYRMGNKVYYMEHFRIEED